MTPIAMVFDELKDYLSESDLSLDYKIARSRSKKKKVYRNSRLFGTSNDYTHQGIFLTAILWVFLNTYLLDLRTEAGSLGMFVQGCST